MPPDYVPGLQRPVSLSEYAKRKDVRGADVLAIIGQLKIPAAFFRGQWYVEAPPGCEERLARLRAEQQPHDVRQRVTDTQSTATKEEVALDSEVERLRVQFVKSHWRYDRLTPPQQEALVNTTKCAERPQPIDYGLSRYDVCAQRGCYPLDDGLKYREKQFHEWRWIFFVPFLKRG
jgi:hypothetical protein